jgi:hypothetical protein
MNMNIALWGIQIILAIKMLNVAYTHGLRQSQPTMQEAMQRMGRLSNPLHFAASVCTFLGVIGLILPGVLASSIWLIPVTALLLSILLLISIFLHVKSRKQPKIFVSVVLFVFAAFVAYGRWILVPL